jgi:hypothetical protein
MALDARDHEAAAARLRSAQAMAHAVTPLAEAYRRSFAGVDSQVAQVARSFSAISLAFQSLSVQTRLVAKQSATNVSMQSVHGVPSRGEIAGTPAVDWLFLGQLTLRALVLAVLLALVIAAWEEQKENAPAQALLGIVGALGFWYYEVDQTIWKRFT